MGSGKKYESLLLEGGLASPGLVSGTFFLHPRGCFIWETIQSFLNKEFNSLGVQNVLFPSLIPLSSFLEEQKANSDLNLAEIMRLHSEKKDLASLSALRPTSEVLFTHFFKERLREGGHKLPILLNQWSSVYREEKNTKLFFRSREFYWQELHSIHSSKAEALDYLSKLHSVYNLLLRDLLCIYSLSGSKTLLERFPGAETTLTNECILPDGQVLQLTTTHYLGNFFSDLFKVKHWVNNKEVSSLLQLSAGCSTRLIGSLVEMHKDEKGIILPWELSREQIAILVLEKCNSEESERYLSLLKERLKKYRLLIENSDSSFSSKLSKTERLGIPLCLIIGREEINENKITFKSRLSAEKYKCALENLEQEIEKYSSYFNEELLNRSRNHFFELVKESSDWEELLDLVSKGKVVLSPWLNSQENESNFKERKYNFSIRCIKEQLPKDSDLNCVFSSQKANCLVYFGRSY